MHSGSGLGASAEANIYDLPGLHSKRFSQSVTRKINDTPGLAGMQTPVDSMLNSIAPRYVTFPAAFCLKYLSCD